MADLVVVTTAGAVRGVRSEVVGRGPVEAYQGVPYGASTGGEGRFAPPRPPDVWAGVLDCLDVGVACPQPLLTGAASGTAGIAPELLELFSSGTFGFAERYGEDCLTVNVWTPAAGDGGRRPVMVWFHGGGWTLGSANTPAYDGSRLATRGDVVVVGVNHRLGALGHLWLRETPGGDGLGAPGNAGTLDLVAALEWVRDNIPAFGGDPGHVTIFGESGGGAKVSVLLALPAAAGLFHRAVVQSGPMLRAVEPAGAARTAAAVRDRLGTMTLSELRDVPADRLVEVQTEVLGGPLGGIGSDHATAPVVDGDVLPVHPFDPVAAPTAASVPLLIGTTRDEMTLFASFMPGIDGLTEEALATVGPMFLGAGAAERLAVYRKTRPDTTPAERLIAAATDRVRIGSIRLAERKRAGARAAGTEAGVWMYRLDFTTPVLGGKLGAPHALDLPFMFDNLHASQLHGDRPGSQELADRMSEAWIAFARHGSPQHPGLPEWPEYEPARRATMIFDAECAVVDDPEGEEREAWEGMVGGL